MRRRDLLAGGAAVGAAALAGCLGGGGGGEDDGAVFPFNELGFTTSEKKSIDVGETVTWENKGGVLTRTVRSGKFHDVATEWEFEEEVPQGGSVSHTFESEGIYEFYIPELGKDCACGAVLVGDVSLSADLPCRTGVGQSC